jgi:hypothetical protein
MTEFDPRPWAWLVVALVILGGVANILYSQRKLRQMREQASVCDVAGAE